jgi:nucleoside-diphosphate-sugar epimerase
MRRVVVTGATGFVGRQVMRALAAYPNVTILPVVRANKLGDLHRHPKVERVIATQDLFSEPESWWEQQCCGADTVIHAAWYAEPGKYLDSPVNIECLIGSLRLARGVASCGVTRFVGVGTCAEYEQGSGFLRTDSPLQPQTLYAATKASLFLALSRWLPGHGVNFAWCRLFYLFGEGENENRLAAYIRRQLDRGEPAYLSCGSQIRDFMDVTEVGEKLVHIAFGDYVGALNVCSGQGLTVRALAERIADEYGRRDLLVFGARPTSSFDPPVVIGRPSV